MIYKLGAHLSIAGGYYRALEKITRIGGNCLQIFSTSPRSWSFAKIDTPQIQQFLLLKNMLTIEPVFFHASYLINLADDGKIGHLSKLSIISELTTASKLKIKGSIIHLGSYKNNKSNKKYSTLITHILEILEKTPQQSLFIIENAGNKKIGQTTEEIAQIINDLKNDRVKVCLDTCHLYSAGYNIRNQKKLNELLLKFDKKIGLNRLSVWHLNDSRDILSSFRDRHENIGQGTLGIKTFKTLLVHPKIKKLPYIIETPGFDKLGPDKKNLDILKHLVK